MSYSVRWVGRSCADPVVIPVLNCTIRHRRLAQWLCGPIGFSLGQQIGSAKGQAYGGQTSFLSHPCLRRETTNLNGNTKFGKYRPLSSICLIFFIPHSGKSRWWGYRDKTFTACFIYYVLYCYRRYRYSVASRTDTTIAFVILSNLTFATQSCAKILSGTVIIALNRNYDECEQKFSTTTMMTNIEKLSGSSLSPFRDVSQDGHPRLAIQKLYRRTAKNQSISSSSSAACLWYVQSPAPSAPFIQF